MACLSTGALFAAILEPILYGKKIVPYELFFGLLVVVGLYIIFNVEGNYFLGILTALSSAFLSALFAVINSRLVQSYDATVISFYELSGGVVFFSFILLFFGSFSVIVLSVVCERFIVFTDFEFGLYGLCLYCFHIGDEIFKSVYRYAYH